MKLIFEFILRLNPAWIMITGLILGGFLFMIFDNIMLIPLGFGLSIIFTIIGLYWQYKENDLPQQKQDSVK